MRQIRHINVKSVSELAEHGVREIVLAIGDFDGVHLGHQRILSELKTLCREEDASPVALTFNPHPREILKTGVPLTLLFPPEKKFGLMLRYGVEALVTIQFTRDFASLTAEDFMKKHLLVHGINLKGICVGSDWRFGAGGTGNAELLRHFAREYHFKFRPVQELSIDGELISSTAIRRAVASGDLEKATRFLGRPYSLSGTVIPGNQIASSKLDHATANLNCSCGVMPPNGVYASFALRNGRRMPAITAIGVSPTFKSYAINSPRIEIHIFDFKENIYGSELEVELVSKIREERCYSSPEALKKQIDSDILEVQRVLSALKN